MDNLPAGDFLHAKIPGKPMCLQFENEILQNKAFDNVLREKLAPKGMMIMNGPCDDGPYKKQYSGFEKTMKGVHLTIWMQ